MRYFYFILIGFLGIFNFQSALAQWKKINDVDYIWGPFKIYNISLFTEDGNYTTMQRPIMLQLKYQKPVDGRDFAISLVRSWSNLGIDLPNQEKIIDRLRKLFPNIKPNDVLSYIALEDRGYFILNNQVIDSVFNKEFTDAILAIWLDPRVDIGHKLLNRSIDKHTFENLSTSAGYMSPEELSEPIAPDSTVSVKQDIPQKDGNDKEHTNSEEDIESKPIQEEPETEISPPLDSMPLKTNIIAS